MSSITDGDVWVERCPLFVKVGLIAVWEAMLAGRELEGNQIIGQGRVMLQEAPVSGRWFRWSPERHAKYGLDPAARRPGVEIDQRHGANGVLDVGGVDTLKQTLVADGELAENVLHLAEAADFSGVQAVQLRGCYLPQEVA